MSNSTVSTVKKPIKSKKPANKAVVVCTDMDQKVKGIIVSKDDTQLVIDLPSGFQMTLTKKTQKGLYVYRVGTLEFVSDGWATN